MDADKAAQLAVAALLELDVGKLSRQHPAKLGGGQRGAIEARDAVTLSWLR
jgi:ABC-type polar amino acid transport system ATPase subunit